MGAQSMKRQLWLERIIDQRQSGMTVAAYCRLNELPEKRYWYYYKKLGDQLEEYRKKNLPVTVKGPTRFVELKPVTTEQPRASSAVIESAKGKYKIIVEENISEQLLMKIIGALEHA